MSITVKKSFLVFLMVLTFIGYSVYLNIYPEKFKEIESNYPMIGKINSGLIRIGTYLTGKTIDISDKSKELYNSQIDPSVVKIRGEIQTGVDNTKQKINSVRKTLSGAEETMNKATNVIEKGKETLDEAGNVIVDINKIGNGIMNSVNTGAMQ
ncbi:MAG: hypothetical protein WC850_01055 [Candidatus Gracilibacteria bacterium]